MSTRIGDYNIQIKIGTGANASVFIGSHVLIDHPLAIKIIEANSLNSLKSIKKEIEMLRDLNHPNMAAFFDSFTFTKNADDGSYQINTNNDDKVALVMELACNGKIDTILPIFSEAMLFRYFSQICDAIDYLHNVVKIVHRDIKIENILLDKSKNVKLIDFGLSVKLESGTLKERCGSPLYSSPELILGQEYNEKTDIWSLGAVLYYIAFRKFPYISYDIQELFHLITHNELEFPTDSIFSDNLNLIDLIKHMLDKNPNTRYSITDIKNHPWYLNNLSDKDNFPSLYHPLANSIVNRSDIEILEAHSNEILKLKEDDYNKYSVIEKIILSKKKDNRHIYHQCKPIAYTTSFSIRSPEHRISAPCNCIRMVPSANIKLIGRRGTKPVLFTNKTDAKFVIAKVPSKV